MDAITEHHYHNIANGKAYENEDGTLSTVKTIIVEIDGVETLIPTVWDGKIVDDKTAIRFANASGIDWPKRSGKDAVKRLEAFDKEIHLQFSDQTTPEEAQEILQNEYGGDDMALGSNKDARKGITTQEGLDMADKKFQRNDSEADTNNDGELSTREKEIADAKQKNELPEMSHGGMACTCGSGGDCGCGTGMMSEPMPIGTTQSEVADDISVMISEGEYVLPANVVKWHGLKHIMDMQSEAEMGLMMMHDTGLIQEVANETGEESDSEGVEDAEVSDAGDSEQEEAEEVIETPEGNEIEVAGIDTVITEPEFDETEDYENSDYGKSNSLGTMKRAKYSIIV